MPAPPASCSNCARSVDTSPHDRPKRVLFARRIAAHRNAHNAGQLSSGPNTSSSGTSATPVSAQ
ncbi:hypothetical protein KCP73_24320 [Salmonella enterica subsp. enterica]|nr:hypothetical protein KCP73_24320 [Salmonella enterica subsp. enterica]